MIVVKGGVTTPEGFLANGVKAGIKKSGRKDLALIFSEVPAISAAAFTTNRFQASPVKISRAHLKNKAHQAVVVNSGNANCADGKRGDKAAFAMTAFVANALGLHNAEVFIASTGVIGKRLPIEKIEASVPELVMGLSKEKGGIFSETIMTTDTVKKEMAVKIRIGKNTVTLGGACKGVGMIHPEMKLARHATMLCFITTDVSISRNLLEAALNEAIEESFNMVSVDGEMSTNDSCFILANGMADNKKIAKKGRELQDIFECLEIFDGVSGQNARQGRRRRNKVHRDRSKRRCEERRRKNDRKKDIHVQSFKMLHIRRGS